jgi:hypothetical protein
MRYIASKVGSGGFLVAGGDATELLEAIDAPLNEITPLVGFAVVLERRLAVRSRWDDGLYAAGSQIAADFVAVITLIAKELVGIDIMKLHQCIVAFDFVRLAGRHIEGQRVAFGVGAEVDFGREAAPRTAERLLILIPPFTPAAC